jgi:hypothetical protein
MGVVCDGVGLASRLWCIAQILQRLISIRSDVAPNTIFHRYLIET